MKRTPHSATTAGLSAVLCFLPAVCCAVLLQIYSLSGKRCRALTGFDYFQLLPRINESRKWICFLLFRSEDCNAVADCWATSVLSFKGIVTVFNKCDDFLWRSSPERSRLSCPQRWNFASIVFSPMLAGPAGEGMCMLTVFLAVRNVFCERLWHGLRLFERYSLVANGHFFSFVARIVREILPLWWLGHWGIFLRKCNCSEAALRQDQHRHHSSIIITLQRHDNKQFDEP